MVAKLDKGWDITKASVKKLGASDPNEKWARWEMVETGRNWNKEVTDENGETTTVVVKGTAFKFAEFYPNEDACRAAEAAFYKRAPVEPEEDLDETMPMPEEDTDTQRAGAAVFLPTLWTLAGGDPEAFYAAIANQPALAKFFDSNSDEVKALVEAGAEGAA